MLRVLLLLLLSICITVPLFPLRVRAHTGLYEDRCQVGGLLSRIFFSERTSTSHLGEKRSRPDEKQSQLRCNATINSRVTPSYPSPLDSKSCLQSVFPFNRGQRGENYDSEKLQIVGGAATIVGRWIAFLCSVTRLLGNYQFSCMFFSPLPQKQKRSSRATLEDVLPRIHRLWRLGFSRVAPLRKGPRHSIFKARRAQPGREQTRQQERGNNERRPSRGVVNHGCIKSRRRKSRESGGTICRGQEWGGFFSLPRHNLLAKLVHEGCWSVFVARGEELKRTTTLHFEFSLSLPPLYPPYRSSPLESPFLSTSFFRISPLLLPSRPDCIADRFSVLFNLLSTTEVAEDLLFLFNRSPRDSFCFPFPLPLCLRSLKTSRRVLFRESLRRFIIFPPAEEKLSLRRRNALTFNVKNLATISQRRTIKFPRSLDLFRLLFGSNFSDYRSLNKVFFEFHFLSRCLFLISTLCVFTLAVAFSLSLSFPNLWRLFRNVRSKKNSTLRNAWDV